MAAALESTVVGLIVAGCALFSAWRLISVRLRLQVLDRLASLPGAAGGHLAARRRQKMIARLAGGGCGSCARAGLPVNAVTLPPANRKSAGPRR